MINILIILRRGEVIKVVHDYHFTLAMKLLHMRSCADVRGTPLLNMISVHYD